MMKRIAGILAITVIAFQALAGTAFAAAGEGFGNPYSGRVPKDDVDPTRGYCEASETLYLYVYYGTQFGCENGSDSSDVLFAEVETPLEINAGGDVVIATGDYDSGLANFRGVAMEITAGGNIIFDGSCTYYHSYACAGGIDKSYSITVTQTGFTGLGLQNVKVLKANSVGFIGTNENETFDASALSVDIADFSDETSGINGAGGNDVLKGGSGNDVIDSGNGDDKVFAGAGDDDITCDAGGDKEQCWGGAGDDVFDVSFGGRGTELTLAPGDGADEIEFPNGGNGAEVTMYYGDATVGQSVELADRVGHGGGNDACEDSDFGEDTATGNCGYIIALVGSPKADTFDASGVSMEDFTIVGGAGNDYLIGASGTGAAVLGGAGNDKLFGGLGPDYYLSGGDGNDRIVGGDGVDYISGGTGDDKIFAGDSHADDSVSVSFGPDSATTSATTTTTTEITGVDTINAGRGNDIAYGEAGVDEINGGKGADRLSGGSGDDTLIGASGNDQLHGDLGDDMLKGMGGSDRAWGDSDSYADGGDGDFCSAEVVAGCEWSLATGPAGPYWVKLQL